MLPGAEGQSRTADTVIFSHLASAPRSPSFFVLVSLPWAVSDAHKPSRTSPGRRQHAPGSPHPAERGAHRRRQRGGQPGNQNALKHGLYSAALPETARQALQEARRLPPTDLTEEIATLRARLSALSPSDLQALITGLALLARLSAAHYRMSPAQTEQLAESLADTVRQLGMTLYPPDAVE